MGLCALVLGGVVFNNRLERQGSFPTRICMESFARHSFRNNELRLWCSRTVGLVRGEKKIKSLMRYVRDMDPLDFLLCCDIRRCMAMCDPKTKILRRMASRGTRGFEKYH